MIIHVNSIWSAYFDVIDLDTNKRIALCQWADEKSGYYRVLVLNDKGVTFFNNTIQEFETELRKGKIVIIRKYSYLSMFFRIIIDVYRQLRRLQSYGK